jgi:hypothetical protein
MSHFPLYPYQGILPYRAHGYFSKNLVVFNIRLQDRRAFRQLDRLLVLWMLLRRLFAVSLMLIQPLI